MTTVSARHPDDSAPPTDLGLDTVESVARIGSYVLGIRSGRWVSSRGLDAVFGIDGAFDRSVAGWVSLIHPEDRESMLAYLTEEVLGGGQPFDRRYRIVWRDPGEVRWVHGRGVVERDVAGRPSRLLGTIADNTEQRTMEDALVRSELRYAAIFEGTSQAILIADLEPRRLRWVNPAACALLGYNRDELLEMTVHDIHPAQDRPTTDARFQMIAGWGGGLATAVPCVRKDGTLLLADIKATAAVVDGVACSIAFFTDVTELRRIEAQDRKLAAAVEQTSDSVVVTDAMETIEYVNPAFERISGYRRDEAVGQNPGILRSGPLPAAFDRALWRRVTRGETWTGSMVGRRKDGGLYQQDSTISPIRGPDGVVTGYVAVSRDVTALRAAESGLAQAFRERTQVAAGLARLHAGESAEETAAAICDQLLGLSGIDFATVVDFFDPRRAIPLAVAGLDGLVPGRLLPPARAEYLYARAAQGPWAETTWPPRPEDGLPGRTMAELGIRAIAYAPIRNGESLLGFVAAGTCDKTYARHLVDHLPAVGEFAATASALLSGQLERSHRDDRVRERVQRACKGHGLRPVFQPIVALESGVAVGYEALTRFTDGTSPDRMFADAHAVGMGLDLEVACLVAALDAAERLPHDAWLSLNVSPDVLLRSKEIGRLVAGRSRHLVIEITEHAAIDDYPAVRRAIEALGPAVSVAVDDSGAGFASLRHVVELRPRFMKLDIGLVRRVDRDVTRQAMIAGLRHFAGRVRCEVIAEGIEKPAELAMLRELGVVLGQGHLLGRPAPIRTILSRAGRRMPQGRRACEPSPATERVAAPARVLSVRHSPSGRSMTTADVAGRLGSIG